MMIEGVITIDRVGLAGCAGMFGEEEQPQPGLIGRGNADAAVDMGQHGSTVAACHDRAATTA